MSYTYPEIATNNPEQTEQVPAMSYEFWAVTLFDQRLTGFETDGEGNLLPIGRYVATGRKYNRDNDVINPVGEQKSQRWEDIQVLLNDYPEFASAYDAMVTVTAQLLELEQLTTLLMLEVAELFEDELRDLRRVYRQLDADDKAQLATDCIQHYPQEWTMDQCLTHLGFADATINPTPDP